MTLTLNDNHEYELGSKPFPGPSVTGLLKKEGFMGYMPGDEYYLLRGQYVHEALRLYFKGTLDFDSLSDGVRPYVESALEYITVSNFKPEHVELSLYSKIFMYCGTLDTWPLIDWKTGGPLAWHSLQMAGYYDLALENGLRHERHILPQNVHLRPDGKLPKVEPYSIKEIIDSKKIFLSAVACWHWKRNHGIGG